MNTLVCLGFGYSAQHYVALHGGRFDRIIGTTRTAANAAERAARRSGGRAVEMMVFDGETAEPALVETAVEEMLRWDGPSHGLARLVAADVELNGKQLKPGDRVFALINAANRDPAIFPEPDRFDVARDPNKHLTFAAGIHFCLGAPLARLEGEIAIATLLRRLADLRLADQELDWLDSMILRGVKSLKLSFRAV